MRRRGHIWSRVGGERPAQLPQFLLLLGKLLALLNDQPLNSLQSLGKLRRRIVVAKILSRSA